ncbi:MAG: hypothetical protein JRI39_00335 [Deltaproteobacteria bacterium]|nr:hypothetical protein [Deltaproteobacteria bacterium]
MSEEARQEDNGFNDILAVVGEEGEAASEEAPVKEPQESEPEPAEKTEEKEVEKQDTAPPGGPEPAKEEDSKAKPEPPPKAPPREPEEPATTKGRGPTEEELQAQRKAAIEQIASHYSLSEEEAAQMMTEPEKVLPQLVGRVFVDVYEALLRTQQFVVPQMLQQHLQQRELAQQQTRSFFEKYPVLNKPEYYETIRKVADAVRQTDPNLSVDEAMSRVAGIAAYSLGVSLEPEKKPEEPAAPQQKPFTPAAPGGAGAPPPKAKPRNEYEQFFEEIENLES